jgi:biopolymer transport protein ExbD
MEKVNMDSLVVVLDALEKLGFLNLKLMEKIWFH